MDIVPIKTPLPCYGSELNAEDPRCQACPHMIGCHAAMGSRAWKVSVAKARFDLIPRKLKLERDPEDPELSHINPLYSLCHQTVFGKHVNADLRPIAEALAENARSLHCSIRLYMLAAMIGHAHHQSTIIGHTDRAFGSPFRPKLLLEKRTLAHVKTYSSLCRQQFGTFTLGTLDLVNKSEFEHSDMEIAMRRSEVIAGSFLMRYTAAHGGAKAVPALYLQHELELDPHWLALEPNYRSLVLDDKNYQPSSEKLKQHRFSVNQCKAFMSRNPSAGIVAQLSHNNIMNEAIIEVLAGLKLDPSDFEIKNEIIKDSFDFWKELGRAVAHYQCLKQYYGTSTIL